jgi:hypothetical protein
LWSRPPWLGTRAEPGASTGRACRPEDPCPHDRGRRSPPAPASPARPSPTAPLPAPHPWTPGALDPWAPPPLLPTHWTPRPRLSLRTPPPSAPTPWSKSLPGPLIVCVPLGPDRPRHQGPSRSRCPPAYRCDVRVLGHILFVLWRDDSPPPSNQASWKRPPAPRDGCGFAEAAGDARCEWWLVVDSSPRLPASSVCAVSFCLGFEIQTTLNNTHKHTHTHA